MCIRDRRRIGLAEKLRTLPLSFFGKRDLSDLTTTMMSDCNDLERVFAYTIPQIFGTAISCVKMCIRDRRYAVCRSWVISR